LPTLFAPTHHAVERFRTHRGDLPFYRDFRYGMFSISRSTADNGNCAWQAVSGTRADQVRRHLSATPAYADRRVSTDRRPEATLTHR